MENLFKYQDFSDLIEKRDGHYITLENPGKNDKIQIIVSIEHERQTYYNKLKITSIYFVS